MCDHRSNQLSRHILVIHCHSVYCNRLYRYRGLGRIQVLSGCFSMTLGRRGVFWYFGDLERHFHDEGPWCVLSASTYHRRLTSRIAAGAIVVEWNVNAPSQGGAGMWDAHIRYAPGVHRLESSANYASIGSAVVSPSRAIGTSLSDSCLPP